MLNSTTRSRPKRIIISYTMIGFMSLLLCTSCMWLITQNFFPTIIFGMIYAVVSSLVLYWIIHREFTLSQSHHEFIQLMDSIMEPIVVHGNGIILDANPRAIRFFGAHHKNDLLGRQMLHFVHEDYRNLVMRRLDQLSDGNPTPLVEEKFITLQGDIRDIEITGIPVTFEGNMAVLIIFRDITERKKMERSLRDSEQRYRSLFDHDGDMIVSVDPAGYIVTANPACSTLIGYTPDEILGCHYIEFLAPPYHVNALPQFQQVMQGELLSGFAQVIHKRGHFVDVFAKTIPIIVDEKPMGFFWINRDMTDQKVAENLLVRSERLSAVGELAAGIAHEIRNPLTALKGFVQLMQSSLHAEPSYLEIMQGELERIAHIVNELLVFSKPSTPLMDQHDCTQFIQEVADLMLPETNLRNIQLTQIYEVEHIQISCDKNRMKQVLVNLVKNAIEAMPDGGRIEMGLRLIEDESISIYVRDNGPGIPEHQVKHLGEPFYTTKPSGTGLGLMVCRKIVESHQGSLTIQSSLGVGTELEIKLPVMAPIVPGQMNYL